ncbi:MAG: N-acetylneuraminate synthase [Pseudomonadota bacterium]
MTFVIAEAGVNHNGDEQLAHRLVLAAADAKADAIKFQTFSADRLVRRGAATAAYQQAATGEADQYTLLKSLELSRDAHHRLFAACGSAGIEFMSTPFDEEAADFLVGLGVRRLKVPSGEITNVPFLRHLARTGLPLILSTGMADLAEVQAALATIAVEVGVSPTELSDRVTILHCTSNYPAAFGDVNLRAMATIAAVTGLPVGYSDHTLGLAVSTAAVALGATVIEKHFTLDRDLAGPDHKASLTVAELTDLIAQIRATEAALGGVEKRATDAELAVRALVRRSVAIDRPVAQGEMLTLDRLIMLRPADGISPAEIDRVIGRRAARDLPAGATLRWSDLA